MFYRPFNVKMLRVLVIVSALAALSVLVLPVYNLAFAQEEGSIEYAENGMGPVETYTAMDPEGTAIVSWMVGGTDAGAFMIDGGVLRFKKSPDYEMPADVMGEDGSTAAADDNIYEIMVTAMDSTGKIGAKPVMVKVTNEEEMGMVELSARQPRASVAFTATLTDPDSVADENLTGSITSGAWQWEKSPSKNGSYTDIVGAISPAYTPTDAAGKSDNGQFLRATVSYADGEGSDKTAMMTSEYGVQALRGSNNAPEFADDQDPITPGDQENAARSVLENTEAGMNIGAPLVATDADSDVLTYTLTAANSQIFDIDWATGQLMTKAPLDTETLPSYTVTVKATDPAGVPENDTDNSDTVMVAITVTNVNEAPEVVGDAEIDFPEIAGTIASLVDYQANDPETTGTDTSTWSITGADTGKFNIGTDGALTLKAQPDYEMPTDSNGDNVYEVTVVATDANGNRGMTMVTVTVENENEDGVVTLSKTQPRVGVPVTASLTDPDGSISGLKWQWYRSNTINEEVTNAPTRECDQDPDNNCVIKDATSDTYMPTAGDEEEYLSAVGTYTDGEGTGKLAARASAFAVDVDTRNKPPVFADQDQEMDGDQNESATRKVAENTKAATPSDDAVAAAAEEAGDNVGAPLTATDPDPNTEPLIYTLGGPDAGLFRVRDNGQIEVGSGTELDYETKQTYLVTVMAEDSFDASASIMVTITVTPVDEVPEVSGDASNDYSENGTGPVDTYTAMDPEGTAIVSWMVGGTDAGAFMIDGGVLRFKKSPDYEMPADVMGEDGSTAAADDNIYEIMVTAMDSTGKIGAKPVMVKVTNEEEMGMVELSARQPRASVAFTATLTDPDSVADENLTGSITSGTWQWEKSPSKNGSYTDIVGAISPAYTPTDAAGKSDNGQFLRATVSYADGEGSDKTAMMTSEYGVQALRGSNNAPEFADDQDPITPGDQENAARSVLENTEAGMNIGAPLVATDADSDVLTYTLTAANSQIFDIDWATGQLMTKAPLDTETLPSYTVTVKATDPAGVPENDTDNSDTVMVAITVTNVNEAPEVVGDAEIDFPEIAGTIASLVDYQANDPETTGTDTSTWSITGADTGKFNIGTDGALTLKAQPDYEMPTDSNGDNVYEVTVVATDANGNRGMTMVTVTVENENEDGVVTLSNRMRRVGVPVTASLTDPDGSISGLKWQWYNTEIDETNLTVGAIEDATSATYTPTTEDLALTLRARASYTDGHGAGKSAVGEPVGVVVVDTRNKPPVFEDQDMEMDGDQNESATRKVAENTEAVTTDDAALDADNNTDDDVGAALTADDPDPNDEELEYTLVGTDAGLFRVRDNGQIEVGSRTELDYETRQTYMVTLMAEDSFGASASIMVTITVTDVDEAPVISEGGLAITGPSSIDYGENGMAAVATYTASGPDADMATLSLGGDDAGDFRIDSSGMLSFRTSPDFETQTDMDTDNVYMVTVIANDGTNNAMQMVTVTVTNVDEVGRLMGDASVDYMENGTVGVGTYMADGPVAASWSLDGDDMGAFNIGGSSGELTFASTPNFEDPTDMGMDNMYMVTVMAAAGGEMGEMAVMVTVTNEEEGGMVTLSPMSPLVDQMITATLTDLDGMTSAEMWQWSRSMDPMNMTSWMDIMDAGMDSYTATSDDDGYYLQATATYTDPEGADKSAMEMTANPVSTVTDQEGTVSLSPTAPQVGDEVMATLTDLDGMVSAEMWQWSRSMDMTTWMDIADANSATYMVMEMDDGYYLRATVSYTDGYGTGRSAMMVTDNAVTTGDPLVNRYDADNSGTIDKSEVIQAINDYLFDEGEEPITKADVIRLINLYLGI